MVSSTPCFNTHRIFPTCQLPSPPILCSFTVKYWLQAKYSWNSPSTYQEQLWQNMIKIYNLDKHSYPGNYWEEGECYGCLYIVSAVVVWGDVFGFIPSHPHVCHKAEPDEPEERPQSCKYKTIHTCNCILMSGIAKNQSYM